MQKFNPKKLGARIKEERLKQGMKCKELAELVYMDASVLSRAEKGEGLGQVEKIMLFANTLGVDVIELIRAGIEQFP